MVNSFEGLLDRFVLSSAEFERKLGAVRSEQWAWPTPCTDWNVRHLVNHMTRGNLNYVRLLQDGTSAEFLRLRDADALGTDPVGAYARSVQECGEAFTRPGALQRILDYPLGQVTGQQALAVKTTDTTVHTWDLARAVGVDDNLNISLVAWVDDHLEGIYAGLAELPSLSKRPTDLLLLPKARSLTTRRNRIGCCAEWVGDPNAVAKVTRYIHMPPTARLLVGDLRIAQVVPSLRSRAASSGRGPERRPEIVTLCYIAETFARRQPTRSRHIHREIRQRDSHRNVQ